MDTETRILNDLTEVVQKWKIQTTQNQPVQELLARFEELLNKLYSLGWNYALGWENELPDEYLPDKYLFRRKEILMKYEDMLGILAGRYGSVKTDPDTKRQALLDYERIAREMTRIGHIELYPDFYSHLPDEVMPDHFDLYFEKFESDDAMS